MTTTPEIMCDVFSFLDKYQIERIQLFNQFWNNVIIRHKNILPLRKFERLEFYRNRNEICLYATRENAYEHLSYKIKFDGTNLSKIDDNVSSRYSQLTVDEVLTNLNDVVFDIILCDSDRLDNLLNMMKLVTSKTGGRFRGKFGYCHARKFDSKMAEIFDNYIIVDVLTIGNSYIPDLYVREFCANPEIVQLPSTSKEIKLYRLEFKENDEVLNFTCNGKLNGANRLTIEVWTSATNCGNFIRQWFELYHTHQNPISLVGKFKIVTFLYSALGFVKTFLNNTQLHVKYSLKTKEFLYPYRRCTVQNFRHCVIHEMDSYALVIEMAYRDVTEMSSINASDLDQPPYNNLESISLCVKSL